MNLPISLWRKIALFSFSFIFIYVGVDHFINPDFYLSIMPPAFPLHLEAVLISGFFEILGGICILIPKLRKQAAWGLAALIVAVYPANIYMALSPEVFPEYPLYLLYFRLILQFFIFYWAYLLTTQKFNPEKVELI